MKKSEGIDLTKEEAFAIAEFIDMNIFTSIRNDDDWDSMQYLKNLIHGYEKLCQFSGFVGLTEKEEENENH